MGIESLGVDKRKVYKKMIMFFEDPIIRPLGDGLNIVLVEDFHFIANDKPYFVPEGFESDWASVPRLWWHIVPPHQYPHCSIVHDFLYSAEVFDRATCDSLFYEALRQRGACIARAYTIWLAVRIGGGAVWARHDRRKVNAVRDAVGLDPIQ